MMTPKIYGFDEIDHEKPIYIVEGPFDSTFLENSIAMVGSDIDIRSYNWSNYIGFLITNLVTEKSLKESTRPLVEEIR